MKVTDEMLERACSVYTLCWERRGAREALHLALCAALTDIPDPEQVRAEIMDGLAYGRSVETQALDARIAELEAKLDKVRAWVEGHAQQYLLADLTDFLDGKEQP